MGDIADEMYLSYVEDDDTPCPEDFLYLNDAELIKETAMCRNNKLKSIRKFSGKLSNKQRYCLAAWLAKRDIKFR